MHNNGGLNVNQKVEAHFGSKMSADQKRLVALNLEGVSSEKDVEARMKFIENECKKSALSRFFSAEKYDTEKLSAALHALGDNRLDEKISVKEVGSLDKNSRMQVAARVVGQNPDLYISEDKAITNRALIEKGAADIVQNKFKPNVNDPSIYHQAAGEQHVKQYTTLPPEQQTSVQYEQLPPSQTQGGGIYSSAALTAQTQIVYDKGVATGNPNLPAHLQPNVGQEAALKRAMAEVDKAPITYGQLPNNLGSQQQTTQQQKGSQGQSR